MINLVFLPSVAFNAQTFFGMDYSALNRYFERVIKTWHAYRPYHL